MVGGMLAALVVQAVLIRAGFWPSRRPKDQAEDYDDNPPPPDPDDPPFPFSRG